MQGGKPTGKPLFHDGNIKRRKEKENMTCIVGWVENNKVYMGGDSAGVEGYNLKVRLDEKVFVNKEFLFGFTSSFRMGQILRWNFTPPDRFAKETDLEYLNNAFIQAVIDVLKKKGYAEVNNNEISGGTFLFGYRGNLYVIYEDFQIGQSVKNYDSVGCGESYALGSFHALESIKMNPEKRIAAALKAAHEFSAGVRPPFIIKSI